MNKFSQVTKASFPSGLGGATKLWRHQPRERRRFPWHLIIFLGPAAVIYTAFMVYPLIDSLRLSLYNNSGSFIGLDNFRTLFRRTSICRSILECFKKQHNFLCFSLFSTKSSRFSFSCSSHGQRHSRTAYL